MNQLTSAADPGRVRAGCGTRAALVSLIILAVAAIAIALFSLIVRLMPYDAYMYLTAAWSFIDESRPFSIVTVNFRQPLYPLLLSPFMFLAKQNPFGWMLQGPHLLAAAITAGYLWTSWSLWRKTFAGNELVLAAVLLVLNPVLIHYGAMPMHDLPAGLLLQLAMLSWLRWRRDRAAAAGVAAGVAVVLLCAAIVAMRLNLGIVVPVFVAAEAICEWRADPAGLTRRLMLPMAAGAVAVIGGGLLMIGLYAWADGAWAAGPQRLMALLAALTSIPPFPTDSWWEFGRSLTIMSGLCVLLIPIGLVRGLRSREPACLIMALSTTVVLLTQSFIIGHKEIRYLLPVAGGLAWAAAAGLEPLMQRIRSGAGRALLLALLLAVPLYQTVREVRRLADPVYTTPFIQDLGRTIRTAHEDGRPIYWRGNTHPIAPHDFSPLPDDEFYAVWHFGVPNWYLALGEQVRHIPDLPAAAFTDPQKVIFLATERALILDGQIEPVYTTTLQQMGAPPPVRLLWFDMGKDGPVITEEFRSIPGWEQ